MERRLRSVVVVWVFGWAGGKLLVAQSCEDAKMTAADQKADPAAKKDEERAAKGAR